MGLTSAGNRDFVEGLNVYDSVSLYDDVAQLPGERAVYVDVSGDGAVRTDIHAHYGERLAHSAAVGMTHWTQMAHGAGELDGPDPSSSSRRTGSRSAARTGARRSWTRTSPRRGPRSRGGPRIGFASSASRVRTTSSAPTSSSSTGRSTRRRAPSSNCAAEPVEGTPRRSLVVSIHDVGEIDGRLYVTMRLIKGVDLQIQIGMPKPPANGSCSLWSRTMTGDADPATTVVGSRRRPTSDGRPEVSTWSGSERHT